MGKRDVQPRENFTQPRHTRLAMAVQRTDAGHERNTALQSSAMDMTGLISLLFELFCVVSIQSDYSPEPLTLLLCLLITIPH